MQLFNINIGIDPLNDEFTGGMDTARKQVKYFMDTRDKAIKEILALISEDTHL